MLQISMTTNQKQESKLNKNKKVLLAPLSKRNNS